jgi:hypothetical protein
MQKPIINMSSRLVFNALIALCMAASLSACVTINIYFPAAAAEKAADKIIDEVWQLKQGQPSVLKDGNVKDGNVKAGTVQEAPAKTDAVKPADMSSDMPKMAAPDTPVSP